MRVMLHKAGRAWLKIADKRYGDEFIMAKMSDVPTHSRIKIGRENIFFFLLGTFPPQEESRNVPGNEAPEDDRARGGRHSRLERQQR